MKNNFTIRLLLPLTLILLGIFPVSAQTIDADTIRALTWVPSDAAVFTYQKPLASFSPTISNYGATFTYQLEQSSIERLKGLADGWRGMRITWPSKNMYKVPADRCAASNLSVSPVPDGDYYDGDTGGDGNSSGYSCPWHNHSPESFVPLARAWSLELAAALKAQNADVDYIAFDSESKLMDFYVKVGARQNAISADPYWDTYKLMLDGLIQARTGRTDTTWDDTNWYGTGNESQKYDWNALMRYGQSVALHEGIFKPLAIEFPGLKGSNYRHAARSPHEAITNNIPFRNSETYYQIRNTGTHASEPLYGNFSGIDTLRLDGYRRLDTLNAFHVFKHAVKLQRSLVRDGNSIMPWIAMQNFDDSFLGEYYYEVIRHIALLGANPILYWNSRTYINSPSTDAIDWDVENVLKDINDQVGFGTPRVVLDPPLLAWGQQDTTATAGVSLRASDGSEVVGTCLQSGSNSVCRVTVQRPESSGTSLAVDVYLDGTDSAVDVTVPADSLGAWYSKTFVEGEAITFRYVQPAGTNLITNSEDFEDASWTPGGLTNFTSFVTDPEGGSDAMEMQSGGVKSSAFSVSTNTVYTASIWLQTAGGSAFDLSILTSGDVEIVSEEVTPTSAWTRFELTFDTKSNSSVKFEIGAGGDTGIQVNLYGAEVTIGSSVRTYDPNP